MSTQRNYMIGTGYHARDGLSQDWFWHVWFKNTVKYANPRDIIVIASGRNWPELTDEELHRTQWLYLWGDLGHMGQQISGEKPYAWCGGVMCWMTLAMIAYSNECDFIYKEQDNLAFGNYIDRLYSEIGNHGCIFGSSDGMPSEESLMMVRHSYIPEFIRMYLGTADERIPANLSEGKFPMFERQWPNQFCRFSFGVGRSRPIPLDAETWHAQKFTPSELQAMAARGLIDASDIPSIHTTTFSNT